MAYNLARYIDSSDYGSYLKSAAASRQQGAAAPTSSSSSGQPQLTPAQMQQMRQYEQTAIGDLNSGNYAGALQAGLDSGKLYGTNYGATTKDPLLMALESSKGLSILDPSKKWSPTDIQNYYNAFAANNVSQGHQAGTANAGESWGKNPYGKWGDPSKFSSDAQANISTAGDNSAPDLMRFAGSRPDQSFLSKYGGDIVTVVGDVVGAFVGDPMAGNQIMALYDATQGNWKGALGNVASSFIPGAGSALGSALDIGTTAGTALAGAGFGALQAGVNGGNIGLGALTGGVGGALAGAGASGQISSALGGGVGGNIAGGLATGAIKAGAGMLGNAVLGGGGSSTPRVGNIGAPPPRAQAMNMPGAPMMNSNIPSSALPNQSVGMVMPQQKTAGGPPFGPQSVGGSLALSGFGAGLAGISQGGSMGNLNPDPNSPTGFSQGNNGNMASTDQTLGQTIGSVLPGVIQAGAGVYGSQNAAEKMTQADANAIQTQKDTLGNIQNVWSPQQNLGQGADVALGSALGTNGSPADYSGFENMPGYKFAVDQGTQAIQRQAAAMGSAYTPNTAASVGQYVTGTAMQDYNTYIQQLMGAAGLGSTANAGIATPMYNTGANISTLQQNQGYAQASGVTGASNAVGGAFGPNGVGSSLIGAAGRFLGGGSGGGTPTFAQPGQSGNPYGGGSSPFNYGGANPNGTFGSSPTDPYGANVTQYNPANGPTADDISNLTGGDANLGNIQFDPSTQLPNVGDITNFGGGLDYGNMPDLSNIGTDLGSSFGGDLASNFDPSSFLGDLGGG